MKLITQTVVLLIILKLGSAAPDPCMLLESEESSACDQTEYEAYKECVHNESKNEVRRKRQSGQSPCPQNNLESLVSIKENCQRANFDCRIACGEEENCQSQCPVCPINVDELIASSNTSGEGGHRTIIVENDQNVEKFHTVNKGGNITTVIRLTNVINTTSSVSDQSEVGVGTDLTNETGGEFGLGFNSNGSCCYVVHPKSCTATSKGRRCHHRREKLCGKLCTAKVVHIQAKKQCNSKGCNGFNNSPLYRQGPVFAPFFYQVPPCYIFGACIPYTMSDGHYGYHSVGGYNHKRRHHEDDYDEGLDFEEADDSIKATTPDTNETGDDDAAADDWAVEIHKCKVVSDNGTIEIRNCTSEDIEENPYAGAPVDVPFDPEDDDYDEDVGDGVRIERHANHHQFHHPQVVYVPVIQDFNYDEATSYEYDFDEAPPPQRHRRRAGQSKTLLKRHHRKTSFVYDDEEEDENPVSN